MDKFTRIGFLGIFLVLLQANILPGQEVEPADSLLQAVLAQPDPAIRKSQLLKFSHRYARSAPALAMEAAKEGMRLAHEEADKSGEALANSDLGDCYWNLGQHQEALPYFKKALQLREEIPDSAGIARSLNNIGAVFWRDGNYPQSMEYHLGSLRIRKALKDSGAIAHSYLSLGILKNDVKEPSRAMGYFREGVQMAEALGKQRMQATFYNYMGASAQQLGAFKQAEEYYQKAQDTYVELGDAVGQAAHYRQIGRLYLQEGELQKARKALNKALQMERQQHDQEGIARLLIDLGEAARESRDFNASITYLERGLELSKQIGLKAGMRDAFEQMARTYETAGNYRQAFNTYKRFQVLQDSIMDAAKAQQLQDLYVEYDIEKKEQQIQVLNLQKERDAAENAKLSQEKQRNIVIGVGVGLLLLSLLGYSYSRTRLEAKSNKQLQHKNQLIEAAKQRSDELLRNILPDEIAEELKETGKNPAPRRYEKVTVLFVDFKGFTTIAQQLTHTQLVAELHECFLAFDKIVEKQGIEKIKTIGDAYMCAAGLPVPTPDHALRAVRAALEMQQFMAFFKEERKKMGKPYFEARIGLHSGPVIAGIVGIQKFAYDIWGDTVNTAARIESSSEVGRVNISQDTYELVKHEYTCQYRGKVFAKNKGEIDMYFVEKLRSEASVPLSLSS
ncbi:MAG: adenylate/guanylate cyclase domain-containing protein [Bacteroidota bacterium]